MIELARLLQALITSVGQVAHAAGPGVSRVAQQPDHTRAVAPEPLDYAGAAWRTPPGQV